MVEDVSQQNGVALQLGIPAPLPGELPLDILGAVIGIGEITPLLPPLQIIYTPSEDICDDLPVYVGNDRALGLPGEYQQRPVKRIAEVLLIAAKVFLPEDLALKELAPPAVVKHHIIGVVAVFKFFPEFFTFSAEGFIAHFDKTRLRSVGKIVA
ncbi:hypothetical protein SDC9_137381 [bioreactor metagenome]|uniref:Uncharacterized protein n=1 Tax=bioreactor metagenome TaxID=1076179 RepID=A0A645DLE2_9ZZZZ